MNELFASLERQEQVKGGTRFVFAGDPALLWGQVKEFVAEESVCCPFFEFAITETAGGVQLEVRLPPQRIEMEGL
jgi:hypothetical protein